MSDTKDTLTVTVKVSSSPFPSPGSPFFPPPVLSPHEYAVMSSTSKRRSTDSRMNAGNNIAKCHHDSAESAPHQNLPATPTVTATGVAAGKPSSAATTESQDRKSTAGNDKEDKGMDHRRGADMDVIVNLNGGVGATPPFLPASPASVPKPDSPVASMPPNVGSNGVAEAVDDDGTPLSDSQPTTPLASNQNPPTTIVQPSSPPSTTSTVPTDPTDLRSSRNSLTSSRPAPPSPAVSRRASAALSRRSSTRSRPTSTSASPAPPAILHELGSDADSTSANSGALSPTTPTPGQHLQQQQQQQARRASSVAPSVLRPLSTWSASSASSSNDDRDDPSSSSSGGSSYGFAGWGLGRLSWFGVRSGAADGGGSSSGGGGPSQGDFERNFEEAVSPSYEIDDPYDSLDDDDDFDDYEDGDGCADDQAGEGADVQRPLLPGLYRALYAFEPEGTAEMALEEDQIVRVVGRGGGVGWAIVARGGDEGHALVPEGYLELVSLDQEQEDG
ncbi:hypothetical protein EDB83DRAFT_2446300 [Lactarius deliciosus]|nr:hypothetical protein EDB83DRAFT_2446300 [Lactarius deliciosus]